MKPAAEIGPVKQEIINYVRNNPGSSKADIIRRLKNRRLASRITVLEYIKDLESRDLIYEKRERPNSQSLMIYVNEGNKLATVLTELEDFKVAYSNLLGKSKDIINNKDYSEYANELGIKESNPDRWTYDDKLRYAKLERIRYEKNSTELVGIDKAIDSIKQLYAKLGSSVIEPLERQKIANEIKPIQNKLEDIEKRYSENLYFMISNPAEIFSIVVDLIFYRSVIEWPEQIKDREQLARLYSVVYSKISEIHLDLSEFIKSIKVIPLNPIKVLIDSRKMSHQLSQQISLGMIVSSYHKLGLGPEIEGVKDSIIKINQDINELGLIELGPNIPSIMDDLGKMADTYAEHIGKAQTSEKEKEKVLSKKFLESLNEDIKNAKTKDLYIFPVTDKGGDLVLYVPRLRFPIDKNDLVDYARSFGGEVGNLLLIILEKIPSNREYNNPDRLTEDIVKTINNDADLSILNKHFGKIIGCTLFNPYHGDMKIGIREATEIEMRKKKEQPQQPMTGNYSEQKEANMETT